MQQIMRLNQSDEVFSPKVLMVDDAPKREADDSEIMLNVANEISGDDTGVQETRVRQTRVKP